MTIQKSKEEVGQKSHSEEIVKIGIENLCRCMCRPNIIVWSIIVDK